MGTMLVPLSSVAGLYAGAAFLALVAFAVLAYRSLSKHLRRSRAPWPGEDGAEDDSHRGDEQGGSLDHPHQQV